MMDMTIPRAAVQWVSAGDSGQSSMRIWAHMTGTERDSFRDWPHDPADLGRCLRLLANVPEWRVRIGEMAAYGPQWGALAARWDELHASMRDEVGIAWDKGRRAPKTYALMDSIIREATP